MKCVDGQTTRSNIFILSVFYVFGKNTHRRNRKQIGAPVGSLLLLQRILRIINPIFLFFPFLFNILYIFADRITLSVI